MKLRKKPYDDKRRYICYYESAVYFDEESL